MTQTGTTILFTRTSALHLLRSRRFIYQLRWAYVIVLNTLFFAPLLLHAQAPVMRIFAISPDWNGKQFCDNGAGYDPGPINAPSMSYSGKDIKEASYTYSWEQQINQAEWTVVASGQGKSFVPSFNPPVLYHSGKNGTPVTYRWRLKIKDVANGNQSVTSDTYELTLGAKPVVNYVTTSTPGMKNKVTINLTVSGGFAGKVYTWSAQGNGEKFPDAQLHAEDPTGLSAGMYTVLVDDKVCLSIKQNINTNASSPQTGQ